jgi:hypothetical protein
MACSAEAPVAGQGTCDAYEGEEVVGLALVTAVQATASVQPGHRPLDHPAVPAQPIGIFGHRGGNARHDLPTAQPASQAVKVVAFV